MSRRGCLGGWGSVELSGWNRQVVRLLNLMPYFVSGWDVEVGWFIGRDMEWYMP